ncbi:TGS domain-containing protein [Candidatus Pacearchaeota archaeon]|nr:TGS domain-containing protein [Candidatus Pacearchaeota archaeon]
MPSNVSPEYMNAEKKYLASKTDDEKLEALEEMLKTMPQHKAGEAMRANIRTRYKKLREKLEKKKQKSSGKPGIKKSELQACLIGLTNSGKSSILSSLTNAKPEISEIKFTTKKEMLGTMDYSGVKIQIIDMPAIESEYFDSGIANISDILLILIEKISDLDKIMPFLVKASGNKIIIFNKIDLLSENERRKTEATLRSKKLNFILFSSKTLENIQELKEKIFLGFNKIRIYTKEPHKQADSIPVIMPQNSTIKDVAEKIFHSRVKIKEARVTGPSSKFPNQEVGLSHILRDKDIVEFKT